MRAAESDGFKVVTMSTRASNSIRATRCFEEGARKACSGKTEQGKLYVGQVWPGRTVFRFIARKDAQLLG